MVQNIRATGISVPVERFTPRHLGSLSQADAWVSSTKTGLMPVLELRLLPIDRVLLSYSIETVPVNLRSTNQAIWTEKTHIVSIVHHIALVNHSLALIILQSVSHLSKVVEEDSTNTAKHLALVLIRLTLVTRPVVSIVEVALAHTAIHGDVRDVPSEVFRLLALEVVVDHSLDCHASRRIVVEFLLVLS